MWKDWKKPLQEISIKYWKCEWCLKYIHMVYLHVLCSNGLLASYCFVFIYTINYKFSVSLWVTLAQELLQLDQIIKESCRLHWGDCRNHSFLCKWIVIGNSDFRNQGALVFLVFFFHSSSLFFAGEVLHHISLKRKMHNRN